MTPVRFDPSRRVAPRPLKTARLQTTVIDQSHGGGCLTGALPLTGPVVSVRLGNLPPIEYSRQEFANLVFRMRARECHTIGDRHSIEKRVTHQAVPGLSVQHSGVLHDYKDCEGKSVWRVDGERTPMVLLKENDFAVIDLLAAHDTLVVGYQQERSRSSIIIKGKDKVVIFRNGDGWQRWSNRH